MISHSLIKSFSKRTEKSEVYITTLWEKIEEELRNQGMTETNKRFYPYLLVKIKSVLQINESSNVILTFKQFLEERKN